MKYTIHINQLVLSETSLKIHEAAILDYLIFLCNSKNPKVEANRDGKWTWVNLLHLIKSMPLLGFKVTQKNHSPISRKIAKIEAEGFIETRRKGRKLLVRLTPAVDSLVMTPDSSEITGATQRQSEGQPELHSANIGATQRQSGVSIGATQRPIKNNIISNTDKDNGNKEEPTHPKNLKKKPDQLAETIKAFEPLFPREANSRQTYAAPPKRKAVQELLDTYGQAHVLETIEKYGAKRHDKYAPTAGTITAFCSKYEAISQFARKRETQPGSVVEPLNDQFGGNSPREEEYIQGVKKRRDNKGK